MFELLCDFVKQSKANATLLLSWEVKFVPVLNVLYH